MGAGVRIARISGGEGANQIYFNVLPARRETDVTTTQSGKRLALPVTLSAFCTRPVTVFAWSRLITAPLVTFSSTPVPSRLGQRRYTSFPITKHFSPSLWFNFTEPSLSCKPARRHKSASGERRTAPDNKDLSLKCIFSLKGIWKGHSFCFYETYAKGVIAPKEMERE